MNAVFPFDRLKAAESASEFIRLAGGKISVLKLVKLMYLLDRESLKERNIPVVGGEYFSMPHGPVTSEVLNSINHERGEGGGHWSELISKRSVWREVRAIHQSSNENLSPYELSMIQRLHDQHKSRNKYQLRDWCHVNCKEYEEIFSGRLPIKIEVLASQIDRTAGEIESSAKEAMFMQSIFAAA